MRGAQAVHDPIPTGSYGPCQRGVKESNGMMMRLPARVLRGKETVQPPQ